LASMVLNVEFLGVEAKGREVAVVVETTQPVQSHRKPLVGFLWSEVT